MTCGIRVGCRCQDIAHLCSFLSSFAIWYSEQTALFLFLLAKAALAYLPIALTVALRPLFPFQQTQYAQVSPLKPAPLSKLFAGLGIINKSATFLLFSSYMTLILSSSFCSLLRLSCYLNLSGRNCLLFPPVLSGYNGYPDICFLRGNDAADELARRGGLLVPSAILCSLFPLISRIHLPLFSNWSVLFHLNSLTYRFPRFPLRNLCSLTTLAVCFFAFASTDTAYC